MLSKQVKWRRRVNRELRKQPAWKTCMQALKRQELTRLRWHHNSTYGALVTPGKWAEAQPITTRYYSEALKLKDQMKAMSRLEFYKELETQHRHLHPGTMRPWARIVIETKLELRDEMKR
jgi:hypothetical protein